MLQRVIPKPRQGGDVRRFDALLNHIKVPYNTLVQGVCVWAKVNREIG